MASEEIAFLRDQVQRLNAVLAEYQEKYPSVNLSSESQVPDIPWVADKSLMCPLLVEYDSTIHKLQDDVHIHQQEQRNLRSQVDKLVAENKRLARELQDAIEQRLQEAGISSFTAHDETSGEDQMLRNMQQQLQMALQEKETAMEMFQAVQQEVDRVESLLREKGPNPRIQMIEAQAAQIKGQYMKTVAELNAEITKLQEELKGSKSEQRVSSLQVTELRKTLEEMKIQMNKQDQEKENLARSGHFHDSRLADAQRNVAHLQSRVDESGKIIESMKEDKTGLEQKLIQLQKKCCDHEQREYEAVQQVRESVQMVETAMLEKDEALMRERQQSEEAERTRAAISSLVEEAGARTRQEVDNVKKQCNQNISRLMEEIHSLELENSEKQAQIDRAIREKRAAESELERLYQEGLKDGAKDSSAFDDLTRRACNAESARDDALLKLDTLHAQIRRDEMSQKQNKEHLKAEVNQLQDRVSLLNTEFESANAERLRLCEHVDDLKRRVTKAEQERDASQRNFNKELVCLEQESQLKEREWEVKLQAAEDSHRSSASQLRQMLNQQQRMSAKWKEECKSATGRFESKLNDIRNELSREKNRNSELSKLLREARDKTSHAETLLTEYSMNIKRMEGRVRDAEARAASSFKVNTPLRGEKDVMVQRKQLQRELERSLRESHASIHSSVPEPLAISDLDPQPKVIMTSAEQDTTA